MILRAVVAACDRLDGLEDGLVSDPSRCPFKPETLLCKGNDGPDCLTKGQVESLKKFYAGFSTSDGKTKTSGFPVGHESGRTGWQQWIVGATPPERQADGSLAFTGSTAPIGFRFQQDYVRYLAFEQQEPEYDWRRFNFDRDAPKLQFMAEMLRPTPDLRAFARVAESSSCFTAGPTRGSARTPPSTTTSRSSAPWAANRTPTPSSASFSRPA